MTAGMKRQAPLPLGGAIIDPGASWRAEKSPQRTVGASIEGSTQFLPRDVKAVLQPLASGSSRKGGGDTVVPPAVIPYLRNSRCTRSSASNPDGTNTRDQCDAQGDQDAARESLAIGEA